MGKNSKLRLFLLCIAGGIFIAFVFMMQRQFNNPDFDYQSEVAGMHQSKQDEEKEDTDVNTEKEEANVSVPEEEKEKEEGEIIEEERQITADLLNIRSGPGPNYEVVETLVLGDHVQVIDDGSDWIEITFGDITGYANRKYLESVDEE
ncbi:SH3 domain-containing protein [Oceanobacillus sp. J11TS1]|uniref:SH3 domain-containing protein n=1 Tax=Oceanobacillus sp. J11TS1 TaxID=2807191 RepID=UPI001B15B808|nr:SH3 domain-containing protein [Oceanobacillus sp. J11TS1]GIO23728.1 hypothetical protein J11TS1_23090 [Oceanobacillus sp. J11TS1]